MLRDAGSCSSTTNGRPHSSDTNPISSASLHMLRSDKHTPGLNTTHQPLCSIIWQCFSSLLTVIIWTATQTKSAWTFYFARLPCYIPAKGWAWGGLLVTFKFMNIFKYKQQKKNQIISIKCVLVTFCSYWACWSIDSCFIKNVQLVKDKAVQISWGAVQYEK